MAEREIVFDALRQLKAEADSDRSLETIKDRWIEQVSRLMEQISGWLQPAVQEGLIQVEPLVLQLSEESLDPYECPGLRIRPPKGPRIDIKPHARFVLGYEGRVDVVSGAKRAMLLQTDPDKWSVGEFILNRLKPTELTEEVFWDLFQDMLTVPHRSSKDSQRPFVNDAVQPFSGVLVD